MTLRWMIAGMAAMALALLTLPAGFDAPRAHAHRSAVEEVAGAALPAPACDAEAKPANFEFTLQDMDGGEVAFASLKGQVILLNFWATWCGPCKVEVPWFVEFADQYGDDGLAVVGVSTYDTAEQIREFSADYDVNYPMLVGLGRADFEEAYGPIWGVPTTLFIDRAGTICRTHVGISTRDDLEKDIVDLL